MISLKISIYYYHSLLPFFSILYFLPDPLTHPLCCPLLFLALSFFPFLSSSQCPALPLCYPGNSPIEKACCLGHMRPAAFTGDGENQDTPYRLHPRCHHHLLLRQTTRVHTHVRPAMLQIIDANYSSLLLSPTVTQWLLSSVACFYSMFLWDWVCTASHV